MSFQKENCQQLQKYVCCAAADLGVEGRKMSRSLSASLASVLSPEARELLSWASSLAWNCCVDGPQGPLLDSVFWTMTMSGGGS